MRIFFCSIITFRFYIFALWLSLCRGSHDNERKRRTKKNDECLLWCSSYDAVVMIKVTPFEIYSKMAQKRHTDHDFDSKDNRENTAKYAFLFKLVLFLRRFCAFTPVFFHSKYFKVKRVLFWAFFIVRQWKSASWRVLFF